MSEERDWGEDLYKKWFRTKDRGGLLSIRPFWEAGKVSVDIGELDGGAKLKTNTKVWATLVPLAIYLQAVYDGRAELLYPADKYPAETFLYYGGASTPEGDVSRVLKIAYWREEDPSSFQWKTGIFAGKKTASGAFLPDLSQPKSQNLIKVSRLEMAEMHFRFNLALHSFAIQEKDWMTQLNGKRRD